MSTRICLLQWWLMVWCLMVLPVCAEQYRSRMYIDLDLGSSENVSMSVGELEQKLGSLQDAATRASAEQFLAQHYAGQKDYGKAAAHIEGALRNPALSADARRELLGQLARVALLQKDYNRAATAIAQYQSLKSGTTGEDAGIWLLLAQVQYQRKHFVESTAALDKALALQSSPPKSLLQAALAIYYGAGSYDRAAQIMQQLVAADINNVELWQQWVSLYLKAGKSAQALDVLALAWEKGLPFREQDILLLTDLYAMNQIPGRGARVLEEAMASGRIAANDKMNDRLFRLWLQAGERDKAQQALEKVAAKSHDTELKLHLAQLQMEKQQWQAMQQTVLQACEGSLPEKLVARANLLLGISQLKLGDNELARRSFINATVVGGASEAAQWLAFMKAAPATKSETIGIAGPCSSADTRSIFAARMPSASRKPGAGEATAAAQVSAEAADDAEIPAAEPAADVVAGDEAKPAAAQPALPSSSGPTVDLKALANLRGDAAAALDIKTAPSQTLYLGDYALTPAEMASEVAPLATRLGITIVKNGGKINGAMHIIFSEPPAADGGKIKVRFGFPVSGNPKPSGRYQLVRDQGFRCAARAYQGAPEGVVLAVAQLQADALARGLKLTGESRQLASTDNVVGGKTVKLELQVGIQ